MRLCVLDAGHDGPCDANPEREGWDEARLVCSKDVSDPVEDWHDPYDPWEHSEPRWDR